MAYLIDGDNLLGTSGCKRTDAARRELSRTIGRIAGLGRKRMVIVFDGNAPPALAFGADVHFAGGQRTADDLILALVRREQQRAAWTVVTSDRSLGDQCRWLGARVERCDRFRRRLRSPITSEKPQSEPDIDYWLEQFGDE